MEGLHIVGDYSTPLGARSVDFHALNEGGLVTITDHGTTHNFDVRAVQPAADWIAANAPVVTPPPAVNFNAAGVEVNVTFNN